jgi:MurNAc alpha-1-phosphate uridylyltransferase
MPLLQDDDLGHLLLVPNPAHHPRGDFILEHDKISGHAADAGDARVTFAGIAVYRPELFAGHSGRFALAPLLYAAAAAGRLRGTRFDGSWWDVGTPQRLAELDAWLRDEPAGDNPAQPSGG